MTPKKGEELFERVGNMDPSKGSLDRLPKILAERWEDNREAFDKMLRHGLQVPEGTVSIAVSLDGERGGQSVVTDHPLRSRVDSVAR